MHGHPEKRNADANSLPKPLFNDLKSEEEKKKGDDGHDREEGGENPIKQYSQNERVE